MPNLETQQSALVLVAFLLQTMHWHKRLLSSTWMPLAITYNGVVAMSVVYFGFATPAQALAGTVVGAFIGIGLHLFLYGVAAPYVDTVLRWGVFRRFGYQDSLMRCDHPLARDGVDGLRANVQVVRLDRTDPDGGVVIVEPSSSSTAAGDRASRRA